MRTINAFECWPFPDREELKQDKIISMLPLMAVPKRSRSRRRRRSRYARNSNRSNICFTDVGGTSASGENLSIRSNLRPRTIEDIFNRKKDRENRLSIPTQSRMLIHLPPPPPPPPIPTYPSMPPPPPRPPKTQLSSPSFSQIENMLNIIVLDDEEDEDPQMVSKCRKGTETLNVELPKSNEGCLTLDEEKEEVEINSLVVDAERTKELRSKFPMKRSSNKNLMVASKTNFAVNGEHNIKIKKKDKYEVKVEELNASKSIQKPNAYVTEKSRFFSKKEKKGVRNNNVELNISRMTNIKMNPLEKSGKRGSYSGLPVNNISNPCSQENISIVKQELFDPIDSEWNKQDKGRDVSIGRSSKEKKKQHAGVRELPFPEDGAKIKPHSGSQLQISSEKVFRSMNVGDSRNTGSNFPDKSKARTNPQGLIFQPSLSNAEMNDRKGGHHDASSPLRLPFSSPPSTWLSSSTATRERLLRPTSSNSFPPNTWNLNFTTPSSNHPSNAMYPPTSVKNFNVPHLPIVQSTPIANQPSFVKSSYHSFINYRKRPAVEIIDFTNPRKLQNVGANSENNTREIETDISDVLRSRLGVDPNAAQVRAFP
ncbi:hypothetical protein KIW84_055112 [Lathyrus oleraceus]|uniref:Uncharacterized protein n=1 Tax=Pisum sativum TaxID=3888 RepID=A0A9D4WXD2_PEA|nr:hypothetical protein KIW84_055112 [Pisum sativum]